MSLFTGISSMNRSEILVLINSLSLAFSEGLNADDLNAAGNFIVAVGGIMLTFATLTPAQPQKDEKSNSSDSSSSSSSLDSSNSSSSSDSSASK